MLAPFQTLSRPKPSLWESLSIYVGPPPKPIWPEGASIRYSTRPLQRAKKKNGHASPPKGIDVGPLQRAKKKNGHVSPPKGIYVGALPKFIWLEGASTGPQRIPCKGQKKKKGMYHLPYPIMLGPFQSLSGPSWLSRGSSTYQCRKYLNLFAPYRIL